MDNIASIFRDDFTGKRYRDGGWETVDHNFNGNRVSPPGTFFSNGSFQPCLNGKYLKKTNIAGFNQIAMAGRRQSPILQLCRNLVSPKSVRALALYVPAFS